VLILPSLSTISQGYSEPVHRVETLDREPGHCAGSGRFTLSPLADTGSNFVDMKCMSAGCARWIFQAILDLISEFESRTQIDDNKLSGVYRLRD
jgi:hypothetical protein